MQHPYKRMACIPRWNDVEATVSTLFQFGIHAVRLQGCTWFVDKGNTFKSDSSENNDPGKD